MQVAQVLWILTCRGCLQRLYDWARSATEQGLVCSVNALTPPLAAPGGPNDGFLRDEALLVILAITVTGAPGVARLARSLAMDIKTRDYIRAAETRGENVWFIMFREILPNARGPLLVDAMLRVGYAIFAIGTLAFLGIGLPPPDPDWGNMVNEARKSIFSNPLAVVWPSIAIASLVIGLNLFADGLREELTRYQK